MTRSLSGLLGPSAVYRGNLVFQGRVRIEGTLIGDLTTDDLVEISSSGRVEGTVDAAQALVAGEVEGTLVARERCTLLETSWIRGRLETPWLDARIGCRMDAQLHVERDPVASS